MRGAVVKVARLATIETSGDAARHGIATAPREKRPPEPWGDQPMFRRHPVAVAFAVTCVAWVALALQV